LLLYFSQLLKVGFIALKDVGVAILDNHIEKGRDYSTALGPLLALSTVALLFIKHSSSLPNSDQFWYLGLSLSLALACFLTMLSHAHDKPHNSMQEAHDYFKSHSTTLQQRLDQALQEISSLRQPSQGDGEMERLLRRTEGMYQQLREQFVEKSELLESTRKQLFHAQEALLFLEKERKEEENEPYVESLKALTTENEALCQETELLHQIIDRLQRENSR
jgi:tRNA C32,U32 (ribose-2'-O)-methylase TrmJ